MLNIFYIICMNDTMCWMNFTVFSTSLCGCYDSWKNDQSISEIINVDTNPMCINLKKMYPGVEDKVVQSIVLGFMFNLKYTVNCEFGNENSNNDINNDSNGILDDDLSVD